MSSTPIDSWSFLQKINPPEDIQSILGQGESVLGCYKTLRDTAAITNKRLIVRDVEGITGRKYTLYSIPLRSILYWTTLDDGSLISRNLNLKLYTISGFFEITINQEADFAEFEKKLATYILN